LKSGTLTARKSLLVLGPRSEVKVKVKVTGTSSVIIGQRRSASRQSALSFK